MSQKLKLALYDCMVKLGGDESVTQVPRHGVNELEMKVLTRIHGSGAVIDRKPAGTVEVEDEQTEYFKLARRYNPALIAEIFRADMTEFDSWLNDMQAQEDEERTMRADIRHMEMVTAPKRQAQVEATA